ncbi:MAG: hypothetical protein H6621_09800 [Halobacteriovoraceae bacterium]|nr:hypothetical protein [Halobacteriovoraceae bacterium]MCB9095350.1 hypothetical protein [Halobacteriovoraceae bacterium]
MNSHLDIKKVENSDSVTFFLSGQIDEDAKLDSMLVDSFKIVIFNLDKVDMINSCGIREWVEFQKKLDSKIHIVYQNCPQVIIEQVNIIKGFIKEGGVVESFYAPYYDPENDEEIKILLTPDEVIDCKAPVKKNKNGTELEFDEIEMQYFNFLKK